MPESQNTPGTSAAVQVNDRLAADGTWVRWAVAATVAGMLAWVAGVAAGPAFPP